MFLHTPTEKTKNKHENEKLNQRSYSIKLTDQKSVATQFNGINTKRKTWIFRAFLALLLCSVVAEGTVLLYWSRRCGKCIYIIC